MGNSGNRFFAEGRRNRVENQIRFNSRQKNEVKANGFAYLLWEFNAISNTRYRCVGCVKFLFRALEKPKPHNRVVLCFSHLT